MSDYYDGTKLLSLKDENRLEPDIYVCQGNRTAGKTVYFNNMLYNRAVKKGQQFLLLFRKIYEMDGALEAFMGKLACKGVKADYKTENLARGLIKHFIINNKTAGFATYLGAANAVKKYSHVFEDVENVLFDEFQPEDENYLDKEIDKFRSIRTSIARGKGMRNRPVKFFLVSNAVSLVNPYYNALGIGKKLKKDSKFVRGNGWVFESTYNEVAAQEQIDSAFNRAFGDDDYAKYAIMNGYLCDNDNFIEKRRGGFKYVCNITFEGVVYAVLYCPDGAYYCSRKCNLNFPVNFVVHTEQHGIGTIRLERADVTVMMMRKAFDYGMVRFEDLMCKKAFLQLMFIT